MAAKRSKIAFVCQSCGHVSAKWLGRCPSCSTWSSMVEEEVVQTPAATTKTALGPATRGDGHKPLRLHEVQQEQTPRLMCGIAELDRVLGGGLVRGALILIGGDPGIGKSTLLLQVLGALASAGERALYVTGEESVRQVALRAERLGITSEALYLLAETRLEAIEQAYRELKPTILLIDSIQTVGASSLESAVGSVGQIRHVTSELMRWAKSDDVITFVVGHVTKEGALAGPRVMEHMVDTVLYFEGERTGPYRLLRAHKNRFGSAQEIGVFEMDERGLMPVANPSEVFLSQRAQGPGAVVVTSVEGSRPLLLEVQALVTPAFAGGTPRRTTTGYDPGRVAMICAVLAARAGIDLSGYDVFVNVAGGVRISEPAVDLGVALALASAARNRAVDPGWVAIGEIGLSGEIRSAPNIKARLLEAATLGFGRALCASIDKERLTEAPPLRTSGLNHLRDALALAGISDES